MANGECLRLLCSRLTDFADQARDAAGGNLRVELVMSARFTRAIASRDLCALAALVLALASCQVAAAQAGRGRHATSRQGSQFGATAPHSSSAMTADWIAPVGPRHGERIPAPTPGQQVQPAAHVSAAAPHVITPIAPEMGPIGHGPIDSYASAAPCCESPCCDTPCCGSVGCGDTCCDTVGPLCGTPLCGSCCGPIGGGRLWLRAEYLGWWVDRYDAPVLLTTAPADEPAATAGILGDPDTTVLVGGAALGDAFRSGARFTVGMPFGACWGIEGSYFNIGDGDETFNADENDYPILARPFERVDPGLEGESAQLVVFNGDTSPLHG